MPPFYIFIDIDVHVCVQIGPFKSTKSERAKLKLKVRLNLHGIVSVESATVSYGSSSYFVCLLYRLLQTW